MCECSPNASRAESTFFRRSRDESNRSEHSGSRAAKIDGYIWKKREANNYTKKFELRLLGSYREVKLRMLILRGQISHSHKSLSNYVRLYRCHRNKEHRIL